MKTSPLKTIQVETGLGNPPKEFTTNDIESGNFIIKYGLHFDKKKKKKIHKNSKNALKRSSTHKSETRIWQCFKKDLIDYGKGL